MHPSLSLALKKIHAVFRKNWLASPPLGLASSSARSWSRHCKECRYAFNLYLFTCYSIRWFQLLLVTARGSSCGTVMFSTGVCQSFCSERGGFTGYLWYEVPSGGGGGYPPSLLTPCVGHHTYCRQAGGTHPTGIHSRFYHPQTKLRKGYVFTLVCHSAANGTHTTGMHSC